MTQRSRFFDSSAGDRVYTSAAWAEVVSGIIGDGVVKSASNELVVTQNSPAAMSVLVGTGKIFIQGYYLEVYSAAEALTISAANVSNPRIDTIVARRDLSGRTASLAVLTGTAAASPSAPALTQNVAGTYEIALANIAVAASATSIVTANITDRRTFASSSAVDATTDASSGHVHSGVDGQGPNVPWGSVSSKPTTFVPTDHTHVGVGTGGTVAWTNIASKPSTFTPATHASAHTDGGADEIVVAWAQITGAPSTYAPTDHTHVGIGTGGQVAWTNISSKPSTFQPPDHTHASTGTQAGTISHSVLTSVSADQHHAKSHIHDGADGSGTVAWTAITGKPTTFAPTAHASAHSTGGTDAITLDDIGGWAQASQGGGVAGTKIWVGTTSPSLPSEGDVWIKG